MFSLISVEKCVSVPYAPERGLENWEDAVINKL